MSRWDQAPTTSSTERVDDLVYVSIVGRVSPDAIDHLSGALVAALAQARPFTVMFDRRAMTAPTPDGRAALERWASEDLPAVAAFCVGWADVYDQKRFASMQRAADPDEPVEDDWNGYPQRTFDDLDLATEWLHSKLAAAPAST